MILKINFKTNNFEFIVHGITCFFGQSTENGIIHDDKAMHCKETTFCRNFTIGKTKSYTVSALIQCAYSIFQNDFLGRTQFKFCAFYSRILPKKWTFDPKMRILLQFQQGAQSIQAE